MSKWVEVTVKSVNTYVVELEDDQAEEDAADIIIDNITYDWDEIDQSELYPADDEDLNQLIAQYDKDKVFKL